VTAGPQQSRSSPESPDEPVLLVRGSLVGLGPLDRRLIPLALRWMNDPEVTRGLGRAGPYTLEMEEQWYERAASGDAGVCFAIYELATGRPIGSTDLHNIDMRRGVATFGISIGDKSCWNRGYGTEATRLILDYAFNIMGLRNVMLSVYSFNARAQRAYEKAGFRVIGRRRGTIPLAGRRFDEILMDAVPEDFESPVLKSILLGDEDAQ
jgi:RimJ/RimL family protein N-acetyltransferase